MIGLIKKDLCMIKNNYKSIFIAILIYFFYSLEFEMNMGFLLPFMGLMICISTINYDDFNNWHLYATSLPQGRTGVVKAKYIITIGVTILLSIFSILMDFIIGKFKPEYELMESVETLSGTLIALIFMMSVLFPILFKYGAEKGRIAMIAIGFGVFGLIMLADKFVQIEISENFINFIDIYFPIIFIVISAAMILISYFISKKIYLKKEF